MALDGRKRLMKTTGTKRRERHTWIQLPNIPNSEQCRTSILQSIGRRNISEALHREVLVPRSSPFCWWGRRHSQRRSCSQDTQQYISLVQDGRLSMSSSVCAPARRIRRVHWDAMIFAYVLAVLKSGSEGMILLFWPSLWRKVENDVS